MGFLGSSHIKKFAEGKTIKSIIEAGPTDFWLNFTDGTSIKLRVSMSPITTSVMAPGLYDMTVALNIVATPYKGEAVVQSVDIEKG